MTRFNNFADAFWDPDIASTRGTDIISKRMKDGRKVCKEMEEYLKERAKAEQQYHKSLSQIARKLEGNQEVGDLGISIKQLKSQTEEIALAHQSACNNFAALAREIQTFNDDQTRQKSAKEDLLKKQQQNKLQLHIKAVNLKEKYFIKCREKDSAEAAYNTARQSVNTKANDLQKFERNKVKAKENMEQADLAYKSAVAGVENGRQTWEAEMVKACKEFQALEEERIDFTRKQMWKITNVDSQCCVQQDECAEIVRQSLEKCDVQREITHFIDNHTLGSERPGPVIYESYYKNKEPQTLHDRRRPQQLPPSLPSLPPEPKSPPHVTPKNFSTPAPRPPAPRQPAPLISFDDDDGAYSSIKPVQQQTPASTVISAEKPVQIVNQYTAKNNNELTVHKGETVIFVKEMRAGVIQVKKNNRCGIIPENCIQRSFYSEPYSTFNN